MKLMYIDPGTGSMLFTILIGIIGAGIFSLKALFIKLRFKLTGGKVEDYDKEIPLVVFSDDKRYWVNFEPICRELDRLNVDVVYMTESEDDPALQNPYAHIKGEFIGKGNKAFAKLNALKAEILLSTTPGLDVYQWKRSKNVKYYVHIPHAASDITLYRMFGIDYYDAILLSGEYQMKQIRKLENLRGLPEKDIELVGIPYMDEMAKRLKDAPPISFHPRTVLLAPSWGKSAIFSVYGSEIIESLLKTGYHVIVRPHPQSFISEKELIEDIKAKFPESENLEWNSDRDNFDVLRRSDILISDFSGVLFEFALIYDKPVIYTNPDFDLGPYDAWWLDDPLWTKTILPQIGCMLTSEQLVDIKTLIDTCIESELYSEGRKTAKQQTWVNVGEGAVNVANFLVEKHKQLTEQKGEIE